MTTERKSPAKCELAGHGATAERASNLPPTDHNCKPEIRYQPMIADRRVRGYLLERADYLKDRDDLELKQIVDSILSVLAAYEPRRLQP